MKEFSEFWHLMVAKDAEMHQRVCSAVIHAMQGMEFLSADEASKAYQEAWSKYSVMLYLEEYHRWASAAAEQCAAPKSHQ